MLRRILYLTGVFIAASVLSGIGAGIGLPHLAKSGLSATTVLGMTALLLGFVALIASGRALVRLASGWRRLALLALLLVTTLLGVYLLAVPLAATFPARASAPSALPAAVTASEVVVPTTDGEELAGWYVPSTNGAAVVLLPGSGSSRAALTRHVEALVEGGYGVLAIDPRGHGESPGRAMDFGWFGEVDIAAAVTFLENQEDVDPDAIGAVGLSMGGEEAIGAAGADPRIQAVVAEGVTGRSAADLHWLSDVYGWRGSLTEGVHWVQTRIADLLTPADQPPPLRESAADASPRPILLVVAGERPDEQHTADDIQRAAPENVETWTVPGAGHTGGLSTDPQGWREEVLGFLDESLRPDAGQR
ncbi:MAG: alpha/beta fold hydrolase [Actinomycetales bacterium]|nr:alpha/beta fold hydrolase [Actinomycetales bacterium]